MDSSTLGAISTVLVTIGFLGICVWAFSPKLKKRFEEDAKLPFADKLQDNIQTHDSEISDYKNLNDKTLNDKTLDERDADKL